VTRPHARHGVALLMTSLLCLALLLTPTTRGALIGTVSNTANTAAGSIYAKCTTAANAIGTAFFVLPLDDPTGTTAKDVSGNARPGTYASGGVTYNQAGPCPTSNGRSVLLDGSTGFVHDPAAQTNPSVFSIQVWFRTATNGYARGGRLLGFGNGAGTTQSGNYDRHLYMTNNGRIVFGVYPNAVKEVVSSASYNDGAWHHAVATLSANGMRLYVDGAQVGSDTSVTSAQSYTGYWRVGWDNLANWTNTPTSNYFNGYVAYAAVFTSALSLSQVQGLYAARN